MHLNILITRPQPLADQLAEKIKQAGGNPIVLPTIEIIPCHFEYNEEPHWIIFTSQFAVYYGQKILTQNAKIAAIGQATATALKQLGIKVDLIPQSFNSESLLASMPEVKNKKILIVCGKNDRNLLMPTLHQRGAMVMKAMVYQRLCPKALQTFDQKIDIILATSCEVLKNLLTILPPEKNILSKPLLVVSPRIKAYAAQLGFDVSKIILAKPSDADIINRLIDWQRKRNG